MPNTSVIRFKEIEAVLKDQTNKQYSERLRIDPSSSLQLSKEIVTFSLGNTTKLKELLTHGLTYEGWFDYVLTVNRVDTIESWNIDFHDKLVNIRSELSKLDLRDYFKDEVVPYCKYVDLGNTIILYQTYLDSLENTP